MSINTSELEELEFKRTHEIVLKEDGTLDFLPVQGVTLSKSPSVYLWLRSIKDTQDTFETLYVGKAGAGVEKRMGQHKGGFKHSSTGQKNHQGLKDRIGKGERVFVYARVSDKVKVLGKDISIYSSEEEALIDRLLPRLNRANTSKDAASPKQPPVTVDFTELAHSDLASAFLDSLAPARKEQFVRLVEWVETTFPSTVQKIVRKYTDQPKGYDGVPMLVFAELGRGSKAKKNTWVARIPLIDKERGEDKGKQDAPLTIILPDRLLNPTVDEKKLRRGKHDNACPEDVSDFLRNPKKYVEIKATKS